MVIREHVIIPDEGLISVEHLASITGTHINTTVANLRMYGIPFLKLGPFKPSWYVSLKKLNDVAYHTKDVNVRLKKEDTEPVESEGSDRPVIKPAGEHDESGESGEDRGRSVSDNEDCPEDIPNGYKPTGGTEENDEPEYETDPDGWTSM